MTHVRFLAVVVAALLVTACSQGADTAFTTNVCEPFNDVLDRLVNAEPVRTDEVRPLIERLPDAQQAAMEEILFGTVVDISEAIKVIDPLEVRSTEQCGFPLVRVLFHTTVNCVVQRAPGTCLDARLTLDGIPTLREQLEALAQ